ncbi:MAG: Nif3-like dinuclear metal center hexameric protein [Bdellovibrionales bacterium]|nr:Nif3-like dinuclear metal center hexameric protein [Bdellovibrionales bacterium]
MSRSRASSRLRLSQIIEDLHSRCRPEWAAEWDNIGLLLGDPSWSTDGAVVSVDLTREALDEARERGSRLIVTHHPAIFRGIRSLVASEPRALDTLMLEAATHRIGIVACHTNFDVGAVEVANRICDGLDLMPLGRLSEKGPVEGLQPGEGYGFYADFTRKMAFSEVAHRVKRLFKLDGYWVTDPPPAQVRRVGFVAGKGASFATVAREAGCDLFITGEAGYHVALEASRRGLGLMELGHRESEFFFLEVMKSWLQDLGLKTVALNRATQRSKT